MPKVGKTKKKKSKPKIDHNKCVACGGSGKSSNGKACVPCNGVGRKRC